MKTAALLLGAIALAGCTFVYVRSTGDVTMTEIGGHGTWEPTRDVHPIRNLLQFETH